MTCAFRVVEGCNIILPAQSPLYLPIARCQSWSTRVQMQLVLGYGGKKVFDALLTGQDGPRDCCLLFLRAVTIQLKVFDGFKAISKAINLGQKCRIIRRGSFCVIDSLNWVLDEFEVREKITNGESKANSHERGGERSMPSREKCLE